MLAVVGRERTRASSVCDWTVRRQAAFHAVMTQGSPHTDVRTERPHVVIVGGGFAGLAAARALRRAPVDITVIDRRNYHLFQPLLYQVATAGLSPGDIAWPIRGILSRQRNVRVRLGRVTGVDTAARTVAIGERRIGYDYLVLATGARHAYFGNDHWEAVAPGIKKLADATEIRERLLLAFERAEATDDPEAARTLLTFVVVGGGPTGVEMAGAIAELARRTLVGNFRSIDPRRARSFSSKAGRGCSQPFPRSSPPTPRARSRTSASRSSSTRA